MSWLDLAKEQWGLAIDEGAEDFIDEGEPTPGEKAARAVRDVKAKPAGVAAPEEPSPLPSDAVLQDTQAKAMPDPGSQASLKARLRGLINRS